MYVVQFFFYSEIWIVYLWVSSLVDEEYQGSIPWLASMVYMDIWKGPSRWMRLSRLASVSFPRQNASFWYPSNSLVYLKKSSPPPRYWNWFLDGGNLTASPLFDGSPYSFGGDGVFIPPPPTRFSLVNLPPVFNNVTFNLTTLEGTGGGCVTTGPFANWTIPFGPLGPNQTEAIRDNLINLIKYNPHCLNRSFKPKTAAFSFTQAALDTLLQSPNFTEFNNKIAFITNPAIPTILNLHGRGHQGMSCIFIYIHRFQFPSLILKKKEEEKKEKKKYPNFILWR